ncbi:MAG: putative aminoglycoside phosphotransferase [Frankiales bacterium]|nr:putative aminoglycoside phosphotransferase [Frankiales bacterium]
MTEKRPDVPGAKPVREEDAVDVAEVAAWLEREVPGLSGVPEVRQFTGGASNLTYLLRYPDRDVVLRRPPTGAKAAGAHDMHREYDVQRRLAPHFAAVPTVLAHDPVQDRYAMEHVPGTILRADLPRGVELTPEQARALGLGVFTALADLHAVDVDTAGLRDLWKGDGYVRRQVEGWSRRYRAALTDDVPDAEDVMAWLDAHQPADVGAVLVHGDWRFDNLVLDPDDLSRVRAVLDWEMATVGDPLMDLGASLAYWVQADDDELFQLLRRQPSNLPGMPTRAEAVASYAARSGREVGDWTFYEVYGLFRLAVIIQQIWFRYRAGQTTNPAFQHFGGACTLLVERCRGLLR